MKQVIFNTDHPQVQLALVLKLSQLKNEYELQIDYDSLEKVFKNLLWRKKFPDRLSSAINEIFSLDFSSLVIHLNRIEQLESYQKKIDDYKDLYLR